MAKAPANAQADAAPAAAAAAPSVQGKKLLIIAMVAIVVALVAVTAVVVLALKKGPAFADAGSNEPPVRVADLSKPPTFVTLEPFLVNLASDEGDRYLQMVVALRVADAKTGDNLKGFIPEIRHRINLLLSGKLPSEISTPEGREDLADEIVEQINSALGYPPRKRGRPDGPVQAVLFNSLIIQ